LLELLAGVACWAGCWGWLLELPADAARCCYLLLLLLLLCGSSPLDLMMILSLSCI